MKAQACIFDFDGVVIDSEKYHHLAWEDVARDLGVEYTYQEYLPMKSAGRAIVIPYLLKKAGIEMTPQLYDHCLELRAKYAEKAMQHLNEKDITPGVVQFVDLLHKNGIPCAVASSSALAHLTAKRFHLFELFDHFIDGEANLPYKPSPELFLYVAKLLNTAPQNCIVFEDSINGLKAAKSANMHCIGIQTYFTNLADRIIDDFIGADLTLLEFGE